MLGTRRGFPVKFPAGGDRISNRDNALEILALGG
jgi:hypothetical protein